MTRGPAYRGRGDLAAHGPRPHKIKHLLSTAVPSAATHFEKGEQAESPSDLRVMGLGMERREAKL